MFIVPMMLLAGCETKNDKNILDAEATIEQLQAEKEELESIVKYKEKKIQEYEAKIEHIEKYEETAVEIINRIEEHATDLIPEIDDTEVDERYENIERWVIEALDRFKMYEDILLGLPDEIIIEQTIDFWTYKIEVLEYENGNVISNTFPGDGNIEVSETDIRVKINDMVQQTPHPFLPPTGGTTGSNPRLVLQNRIDELIMQQSRLDLSKHVEVINAEVDHFYRSGSGDINTAHWVIKFKDDFADGDEIHLEITEELQERIGFDANRLTIKINTNN